MANIVDSYDFIKSSTPQGVEMHKPYTSKQFNYINDINNGVYANTSQTLLQYDLTSIFNSAYATNVSDHYLIIPTVTTMALTNGANVANATVLPNANSYAAVCLKTGTNSLVHSADLQIDGKTIVQIQPFTNIIQGINLASSLSVDDLKLHGQLKGYPKSGLDNPNSQAYKPTGLYGGAAPYFSSPGIVNNTTYSAGDTAGLVSDQNVVGPQFFQVGNTAIQEKVEQITDLTSAATLTGNGLNGIQNSQTLGYELQPYTTIVQTSSGSSVRVWYNYQYIRLGDIFPVMDNIGITRRFSAVLRLYVNTGVVSVGAILGAAGVNPALVFRPQFSTFTNTCPVMINNLGATQAGAGYSDNAFTDITVGFFIGTVPNYTITTFGGTANGSTPGSINFGGVPASQINNTRYYYSSILIDSLKYADYLASNQSKTIVSKSFLYNNFTGITAGSSWSQLVQSGVKNIRAVMVIPLLASSINNFSQYQSPFDPCGGSACGGPFSLINFNVSVGGVQQLSTNLNYTFEDFVEQISIFNKSSNNEYGVESGLISYEHWLSNRFYLVNVRSTADDDLSPRNIVVQLTNNNLTPIDVIIYTLYEEEHVTNVATGSFTQKM
jgi:hypothetical protein